MDLLEIVLRSCDAEKYIQNFRSNGIDSYVLKILTKEDLEVIGIDDEDASNKILNHSKNLQIPSEKKRSTTVDNEYLCLVLSQISVQLNRHYANLSYALKREDIDLCYIKLQPAGLVLESCLMSLEKEVESIQNQVLRHGPKKRKYSPVLLISTLGTTGIFLFVFIRFWASNIP